MENEAALMLVAQRLLAGDPTLAKKVGLAMQQHRGRLPEISQALARCLEDGRDIGRLSAVCGLPPAEVRELLELGARTVLSSAERRRVSELLTRLKNLEFPF
jgi:2-keto-3-deoxy-L-rhamnonate aldolase RhmA